MKRYLLCLLVFVISTSGFAQEQFSVYFDSNKFEVTAKEKETLNQWILENCKSKIVAINGFTDEDGTTTSNDTLAQKRVDFILKTIKDKVKIREDGSLNQFNW